MKVIKWQCPGYPGNEQPFPCPNFEAKGFPVKGDFSTKEWPDWAYEEFQKELQRMGTPFGNLSPLVSLSFFHQCLLPKTKGKSVLQRRSPSLAKYKPRHIKHGAQYLYQALPAGLQPRSISCIFRILSPRLGTAVFLQLYLDWLLHKHSGPLLWGFINIDFAYWLKCAFDHKWPWKIALSMSHLATACCAII